MWHVWNLRENNPTMVKSTRDLKGNTLEILFNVMLNMGKIDNAYAAAVKMKEIAPDDQQINDVFSFISNLRTKRDITKKIVELAQFLTYSGEARKVKALLEATPEISKDTPFYAELYKKNNPPKIWKDNEIAIYCGAGFTQWSPQALTSQGKGFLGGSEEAVVRMSSELAKLGWKLIVYADPGNDEGEYDGVTYLPYFKFNHLDRFNILIVWRQPGFFENNVNAKKKYLWLHDVQNPLDYSKERVAKIDKVFFLSKWHRDNVPDLPEEKVFITTNGI